MQVRKIRALGSDVDAITLAEAIDIVVAWVSELRRAPSEGQQHSPCRYVVTPNLDHTVMLRTNPELRASYADAALVLADGMPLIWASKLTGRPLPERVAGSDLGPGALASLPAGSRVFLLGASEQSSARAATNIQQSFPHLEVAGRLSPPPGFQSSEEWSERITSAIRDSGAQLVLVGLGAPKQEIWVHRHRERLPGTVVLCIGATIDFLSGEKPRAPVWAQRTGLEWLHRMLTDPKRLVGRYAKDAFYFPALLLEDLLHRPDSPKPPSDVPN